MPAGNSPEKAAAFDEAAENRLIRERLCVTLDKVTLSNLRAMTRDGGYVSLSAAVRGAVNKMRLLQEQALRGYDELILRDKTGREKIVLGIPFEKGSQTCQL